MNMMCLNSRIQGTSTHSVRYPGYRFVGDTYGERLRIIKEDWAVVLAASSNVAGFFQWNLLYISQIFVWPAGQIFSGRWRLRCKDTLDG